MLNFFFEEQTQLKWTANNKINKLSFKVAWEKASDVDTADWLNLSAWNIPVNHDMLRGTFSRLLFACSASIPAFLFIFRSAPMTLHKKTETTFCSKWVFLKYVSPPKITLSNWLILLFLFLIKSSWVPKKKKTEILGLGEKIEGQSLIIKNCLSPF